MKKYTVQVVSNPKGVGPAEKRSPWALMGRMACYSLCLSTVWSAVFGIASLLLLLTSWAYVAATTPASGPVSHFQFEWGAILVVATAIGLPLLGGLVGGATGLVAACYSPPREAVWPFASQFFRCVWRNLWGWTLGSLLGFGLTALLGGMLVGAPAWALLPAGALLGHLGGAWRGVALARRRFPGPAPMLPEVVA